MNKNEQRHGSEDEFTCFINQRYKTVWYMEYEKYNKLVNITKKKQTHRYKEQTSGYQWGGRVGERGNVEAGD